MQEQTRVGIAYLEAVTALLQRVRSAHPTAGVYEAADFQWWWGKPRPTDLIPQLFWFNEDGRPEAAVIATDWGDAVALDAIVMPDATPDWVAHVVQRGLAHAKESGFSEVDFAVDPLDAVMVEALAAAGYTKMEDEYVDSWLDAAARPAVSPLHSGYRLATRLDTLPAPHHMDVWSGQPRREERLQQTPLYRPDLDLVVLDNEGETAAFGLFWFDAGSATGLVEPMRTIDEHQRRGLARHVLTSGLNLLFDAGAERVAIAWDPSNLPAHKLYTDVGFTSPRRCSLLSLPSSTKRRY